MRLFINAMPTKYKICHDFNCHINEREISKSSTNHKGSISCHWLLIVSGRGHTHAYRHRGPSNFKKLGVHQQRPESAWFKILYGHLVVKFIPINIKSCIEIFFLKLTLCNNAS